MSLDISNLPNTDDDFRQEQVSVEEGAGTVPAMVAVDAEDLALVEDSGLATVEPTAPTSRSLREICPKVGEHSLGTVSKTRLPKAKGQRRRTAFKDKFLKEETSLTRTLNSCVRCRILKIRVSCVPEDP